LTLGWIKFLSVIYAELVPVFFDWERFKVKVARSMMVEYYKYDVR